MFSRSVTLLSALTASLFLVACGGNSGNDDDGVGGGPCEADPAPAECDQACSDSAPCPSGYFCDTDNTCSADCTPGGSECASGEECDGNGQCSNGGDDGANDDDDGGDDECPAVEVNLTPVIPLVVLLIDQSGSMTEPLPDPDGPERWDALKAALIGENDDGVLFQLQSSVEMGSTLYTNTDAPGDACPQLQEVAPAINNASAIAAQLEDQDPLANTPTAESIDAVTATFPESDNPRVIVLATDGAPDTCADPDAHNADSRALSETAVQNAFTSGLQTFILSVGDELVDVENHLQRMANAGQGLDLDAGEAPFFVALDPAGLVTAFENIIGGIRTCEITVDG